MATSSQEPVIISQPLLNSIPDNLVPRVEPTYVEYWNKYNAGRLATHQIPIEAYRADPARYTIAYGREIVDKGNLKVTDQKCPVDGGEINIRTCVHGGGWVFGGLPTDFDFRKRLSHELGVVAFDVDYRLAPEHKFPITVNDSWQAFNWIREHKEKEFNLDLSRIAIGGCSAGGHLSAVITHLCRDASIPLAFQLLSVPVCDMHVFTSTGELRPDQPYASYREMEFTQPLPAEHMAYFHKAFLGNPRPKELNDDWKVSPMLAKSFKALAPALVITAECDPLRDEGEEYARKMNEAGSKAEVVRINGVPHIFMQLDAILEDGKEYNRVVVRALREALHR